MPHATVDGAEEWIPTPSRKKAMDWALVLASQSIEARIEPHPERGSRPPCLVVQWRDGVVARAAIEAFQSENRRPAWREALGEARIRMHPAVLLWATVVAMIHWADATTDGSITRAAASNSTAVAHGEWWRLFTAVWLHADIAHLASNLSLGVLLLGLAMGSLGPWLVFLTTFAAGALGNLVGYVLYPKPFTGVGASGMVLAAAGMLAGRMMRTQWVDRRAGGRPGAALFAGICLFVLLGVHPGTDQVAHATGFLSGAIGGAMTSSPARS